MLTPNSNSAMTISSFIMCFHRSLRHKLPEQFLLFKGLPPRYGLSAMRVKRFRRAVCLRQEIPVRLTLLTAFGERFIVDNDACDKPFFFAIRYVMVSSTGSPLPAQWVKLTHNPDARAVPVQSGAARVLAYSAPCKRLNAVQVIEKEFREGVSYSSTRERSSLMYRPL